ncbi:50S ribosomal protein L24 [Mycena maculata]|uniref:Large ribosomal subunit protein bL28c n=1 Tax=Mycena maculata TaxID=230809 RepID=A0AAD7K7C4_9AGAR|nr:50S ribosomal protein L24 [Mycena maculata]
MRPTIAALGARAVSEVAVTPQPFKRSQFGLFQGKSKQYGNSVPFSLHKTRRTWLPNVQRKRLFSETLQSHVQVKVTTSALKTIKKKGGVDNYVMQTRAGLLGWKGMQIRLKVREAQSKNAAATDGAESKPTQKSKMSPFRAAVPDPARTLKALSSPTKAKEFVRHTRRMAAKALGMTGFASCVT